ncbi:MAG TPA: GH1 family beta-glucosidase [Actinomycetota bacterium]|nr:GH1 family beta-glucosidase [Actinomycetota bacterium]
MPIRRFPDGFVWGAATASYQIEGAADADGRGESIWDRFSHTPGRVRGGDTGDVACDHYHRYREDVALMAQLGLTAYRFSVSWPRVVPEGTGPVNEAGLDFYDRLVDELVAHGIAPHVTLYHWDLPQRLEDAGGWPVRATAEAFGDYVRHVAARLGDRVKHFATLNEPNIVADHGYRSGEHAPGRTEPAAALAAAHHLLVGHGLAVRALREEAPGASAGIVLNLEPKHPATAHPLDLEAAAVAHDQVNRWFLDPVVGRGYPEEGVRAWGWDRREIRDGDDQLVSREIDFLGVNYYSRSIVRSPLLEPLSAAPDRERTGMGWEVYPAGLVEVLELVTSRTGDLPLYVTENGAAYPVDGRDPTRDPERVHFLHRHLDAALTAIERGVPLRGYFVWSLLDNFEWAHGYNPRFGIVHVDYESLERRVRDSGRFWASVPRDGLPELEPDAVVA